MKRDRDFARELLLKMQGSREGFISHALVLDADDEELKLDHHLDLLMDEGLVAKKGKYGFRLTPLGHDAVEAIEKPETWKKLRNAAPREAYEIVKGIGSSLSTPALSKVMGWG